MTETRAPAEAGPDLTDRTSFDFWSHEVLRFSDTDAVGHINHGAVVGCLESARLKFALELGRQESERDLGWMLVRLCVDFRGQLFFPDEVDVGLVVTNVGRSSLTLGQGLFRGDVCCATATAVLVLVDATSDKASPIPDDLRARLMPGND